MLDKVANSPAAIYMPSTPSKPVTYSPPKPQTAYQQVAASNKEAAKTSPDAVSIAKSFFDGVYDAGKSTVEGVVNIAKHPVQTAEAIGTAVTHPVETGTAIKNAAVTTYNEFKNGDANERAHMLGTLTTELALAAVGTKGLDKAVKGIKGAEAAGAAADLSRVQKIADISTTRIDAKEINAYSYSSNQTAAIARDPNLELTGGADLATKGVDKAVKNTKGAEAAGAAADLSRLQKITERSTKTIDVKEVNAYSPSQTAAISRGPTLKATGEVASATKGAGEANGVLGGAYKDITRTGGEIHHMPADSVSPLSRGDGPAINMETVDHRQTASWGSSKEAQMFRTQQKNLIEQGDFKGAQQMDIDDVVTKFGDKYNQAIEQMKNYSK